MLKEGVDVAVPVRVTDDENLNVATRRLRAVSACLVATSDLMAQYHIARHPRDMVRLPFLGAVEADWRVRLLLIDPERER